MPNYTHGGDVWGRETVLDFSANLHPLGMPPEVAAAARAAVGEAGRYPDPYCAALRAAIAARDGVGPDEVICGAGAGDLIFRLCLALRPRRALVTAPAFSEYERGLALVGCAVERYPLRPDNGFDLDDGILDAIDRGPDVLFLCSPNNPTGRLIDRALLQRIADRCEARGTRLIVDECFVELSGGTPLRPLGSLFLLRAFTKTYAIPGLRLGYGLCADRALLERLYEAAQPWTVSNVAQAAGLAACSRPDWPERGRALLRTERPRLAGGLRGLGLTVWDGQANYLLFRAPGRAGLREALLDKGVLIRSCWNFAGLSDDDYRVCVRTGEDNDCLLQALREVL